MPDDPSHGGDPPSPIDRLTIVGRLLLIFTIPLFSGACIWLTSNVIEDLPTGSYPLICFLAPGIVGGIFFFITARILERLGVRMFRQRDLE